MYKIHVYLLNAYLWDFFFMWFLELLKSPRWPINFQRLRYMNWVILEIFISIICLKPTIKYCTMSTSHKKNIRYQDVLVHVSVCHCIMYYNNNNLYSTIIITYDGINITYFTLIYWILSHFDKELSHWASK